MNTMIPLSILTKPQKDLTIAKISGKIENKQHLADLGIVVGSPLEVICVINGSFIVKVKGTKIALNPDLAKSIYVLE